MLLLNPGHRNSPFSSLRNQLTRKINGGSLIFFSICSQWFQ